MLFLSVSYKTNQNYINNVSDSKKALMIKLVMYYVLLTSALYSQREQLYIIVRSHLKHNQLILLLHTYHTIQSYNTIATAS